MLLARMADLGLIWCWMTVTPAVRINHVRAFPMCRHEDAQSVAQADD